MKARLLKKWGSNYAGQVLSNVEQGSIPAGVAEFFEDDDPAINTVVPHNQNINDPLMVINDEINPESAKAHNEAQRSAAKASQDAALGGGIPAALESLEEKQTQERAIVSSQQAAAREDAPEAKLSKGQIEKNAAGKGPRKAKK